MNQEQTAQNQTPKPNSPKKAWVTPEVNELSIGDLTDQNSPNIGADASFYS